MNAGGLAVSKVVTCVAFRFLANTQLLCHFCTGAYVVQNLLMHISPSR